MNISSVNAFKLQNFTSNYPVNGRTMSNQGSDYVYPIDEPEEPKTNGGRKKCGCEECEPRIHWQSYGDGVLVPILVKE